MGNTNFWALGNLILISQLTWSMGGWIVSCPLRDMGLFGAPSHLAS